MIQFIRIITCATLLFDVFLFNFFDPLLDHIHEFRICKQVFFSYFLIVVHFTTKSFLGIRIFICFQLILLDWFRLPLDRLCYGERQYFWLLVVPKRYFLKVVAGWIKFVLFCLMS
jgi:hypothetical protein